MNTVKSLRFFLTWCRLPYAFLLRAKSKAKAYLKSKASINGPSEQKPSFGQLELLHCYFWVFKNCRNFVTGAQRGEIDPDFF